MQRAVFEVPLLETQLARKNLHWFEHAIKTHTSGQLKRATQGVQHHAIKVNKSALPNKALLSPCTPVPPLPMGLNSGPLSFPETPSEHKPFKPCLSFKKRKVLKAFL